MAPKRSLNSLPSTPVKKKVKIQKGPPQRNLESFFERSPSSSGSPTVTAAGTAKTIHSSPLKAPYAMAPANDEKLAFETALEGGVDLEMTRKLEMMWKSKLVSSAPDKAPEVIDVDSSDREDRDELTENNRLASSSRGDKTHREGGEPSEDRVETPSRLNESNPSPTRIGVGVAPSSSAYPSLSVDSLTFVADDCPWHDKSKAPYSFLAYTLSSLSETRSRIAIINILTNALRLLLYHHPPSLLPALYLLSNSLSPPYLSVELGLGHSVISKAIQHISGLTRTALKHLYNTTGDVGDVAYEAKSNVRTLIPHPPLHIQMVYESLLKISRSKGEGASKQKQSIVEKLLVAAKGEEVRYLVRTLSQNIRVGAVRTSIITALARAVVLTHPPNDPSLSAETSYYALPELLAQVKTPSTDNRKKIVIDSARADVTEKFVRAEGLLKRIYVQHPNFDHIVTAILEVGFQGLADHVSLAVGIPLHPTLGSPTRSLDEIYERLGNLPFTAELKYDGQRAQIHGTKDDEGRIAIKIFSRHLEDMTDKYPDVISLMQTIFATVPETSSFIIDSEIVAIDPSDGGLRSFQELSNRARKDVQLHDVTVSVCVFAFDLMYYNGKTLLEEPFRVRREQLRTRFPPMIPEESRAARLAHVECCESEDGREEIEQFWQRAIEGRSEGLMVKLLDHGEVLEDSLDSKNKPRRKPLPATYEPDKRTSAWLKLKKDYVTGLGDSLDVVPIGAWHGNGRKAQWWSPILLGLWDESSGQFVGVCKCMSGFSDNFYKALQERYAIGSGACSLTSLWNVDTGGLKPGVYFKPQEVWEIRGADITLSPVSTAALGLVSPSRGLSLRFPRFIRLREDKNIEDASTPALLARMWTDQERRGKDHVGMDDGELVDVVVESSAEENDDDDDA